MRQLLPIGHRSARAIRILGLCALGFGGGADAAPIAPPQPLGAWGSWRAATHREAGGTVCYAYARPAGSTPLLAGRGAVVLTVTERAGAPRDAVALSAGFTYPQGSTVEVTAGKARFAFYTASRSAFARNGHEAVRAFAAADRAEAHSPAPHARQVTDTFSLSGFDAAHQAIVLACPHRAAHA